MSFGYDPTKHDALRWSVIKSGKRWDRSFQSDDAAWRALRCISGQHWKLSTKLVERRKSQGYEVVPIAWSYKKQPLP